MVVEFPLPQTIREVESALAHTKATRRMPGSIFASEADPAGIDEFDPPSEPSTAAAEADAPPTERPRRRNAFPPEVLVIVRPTGRTRQQHPHNVQVQLLLPPPPPQQGRSPERGASLSRSASTSSDHSEHSEGSSRASASMTGYRVMPLYNLDLHTIRPTNVLDASTEQRVAKVTRKGIELDSFGLLQPHELVIGVNDMASLGTNAERPKDEPSAVGDRRQRILWRVRDLRERLKQHMEREQGVSQSTSRRRSNSSPAVSQTDVSAVVSMTPGAGRHNDRITEGYFWVIKGLSRSPADRAKAEPQGPVATLDKIWSHFNALNLAGIHTEPPPPEAVPVRFEWMRDVFASSLFDPLEQEAAPSASPNASPSAPSASLDASSRTPNLGREYADLSTWTCFIVLGEHTAIPIGQLVPVDSHPLIVGQITVPFPLPDLSYSGLASDNLGFTREELKDIVVTTALHLVIRESIDE